MKNRSTYLFVPLFFILLISGKISAQNNNEEDDVYYSGHSQDNNTSENNYYQKDSAVKNNNPPPANYYDPYYDYGYYRNYYYPYGGYYYPYGGGFYPYISFYPYRWHFWCFNSWFHPGYWEGGHYCYGRRNFAGRDGRYGNHYNGHRNQIAANHGGRMESSGNRTGSIREIGNAHQNVGVRPRGNVNMLGNRSQVSPNHGRFGTPNSRPGSARGGFGSIGRGGFSSGS